MKKIHVNIQDLWNTIIKNYFDSYKPTNIMKF